MVSIPPHTSHKTQPLDRTVFGPLKRAYARQCTNLMKTNRRRITQFEVASLFNAAYTVTATLEKAISGFRCCGSE